MNKKYILIESHEPDDFETKINESASIGYTVVSYSMSISANASTHHEKTYSTLMMLKDIVPPLKQELDISG